VKLIIQIPCLNEAETLEETVRDLPEGIPGVDTIEYLVVDDGSDDGTADVARRLGVQHVLELRSNRGLATAFLSGVEYALAHGADIVVNTDGDNQYCGADIPKLVQPILDGQADLVVGCRPITDHPEFSWIKKILQQLGSWTLRYISKTTVRDAASGFRAFSRETCQRLFVYSRFSYCMETLIQAGNSRLRVLSVDIGVNKKRRESRLFKSIPQYIYRSGSTMISMFVLYRPGRFFFMLGSVNFAAALVLGLRFLYLTYWTPSPEPGRTYLPSLILLGMFAGTGVLPWMLGIIGEVMRAQRRLSEESLFLQRKQSDME